MCNNTDAATPPPPSSSSTQRQRRTTPVSSKALKTTFSTPSSSSSSPPLPDLRMDSMISESSVTSAAVANAVAAAVDDDDDFVVVDDDMDDSDDSSLTTPNRRYTNKSSSTTTDPPSVVQSSSSSTLSSSFPSSLSAVHKPLQSPQSPHRHTVLSSILSSIVSSSTIGGILHAIGWVSFSLYFPFWLAPSAATRTYHKAGYVYDEHKSLFDNTAWTYGTDYALAIIMSVLATTILVYRRQRATTNISDKETCTTTTPPPSVMINQLCHRSAALLLLYGVSVTAGGLSHQHYLTVDDRNTIGFRLLWSLCVGTVCAASCAMGMSGSTMIQLYQHLYTNHKSQNPTIKSPTATTTTTTTRWLLQVPIVSNTFWLCYGLTVTAVCVMGGMSFQRPACDIFIAGITQSPSTFYCMLFFFLVDNEPSPSTSSSKTTRSSDKNNKIQPWAKIVGLVGFILNAPLLPMYPLLVQYTDWSLASVNTLLHSWLCVAWCMQGISMRHVIQVLSSKKYDGDNEKTTMKEMTVGRTEKEKKSL